MRMSSKPDDSTGLGAHIAQPTLRRVQGINDYGEVEQTLPGPEERALRLTHSEGTTGNEHLGHRHRQPDPQPAALPYRRWHPGGEPHPDRKTPAAWWMANGSTGPPLTGRWLVSARTPNTSSPPCIAAPTRSRSAPSAPAPGAAPRRRPVGAAPTTSARAFGPVG